MKHFKRTALLLWLSPLIIYLIIAIIDSFLYLPEWIFFMLVLIDGIYIYKFAHGANSTAHKMALRLLKYYSYVLIVLMLLVTWGVYF